MWQKVILFCMPSGTSKSHRGKKPYQCEDCHKAFITHFLGDTRLFILKRKPTSVKSMADGFRFLQPLDDIEQFIVKQSLQVWGMSQILFYTVYSYRTQVCSFSRETVEVGTMWESLVF